MSLVFTLFDGFRPRAQFGCRSSSCFRSSQDDTFLHRGKTFAKARLSSDISRASATGRKSLTDTRRRTGAPTRKKRKPQQSRQELQGYLFISLCEMTAAAASPAAPDFRIQTLLKLAFFSCLHYKTLSFLYINSL